jgi:hypothetical protein
MDEEQLESRAVEEEEEDDDDEMGRPVYNVVVRWSRKIRTEMLLHPDLNIECHTFILGIGPIACCFLDAYVFPERTELIGAVSCGHGDVDLNTVSQRCPTDKSCLVYRSMQDLGIVFCLCNIHIPPELAFFFGEKVLGVLTKADLTVAILCANPASDYKTGDDTDSPELPLVRCLRADKFTHQLPFGYLEQPNFVAGLPAAALQFCQVYKIPGVLYSSYTETQDPDSDNISAFTPVLTVPPFNKLEVNPEAEDKIKEYSSIKEEGNSLFS